VSDPYALFAILEKEPSDMEAALAASDGFEEAGESDVAFALRWMVKFHRHPHLRKAGERRNYWQWDCGPLRISHLIPSNRCALPYALFRQMAGVHAGACHYSESYETAVRSLAIGLAALKKELAIQ